MEKKTVVTPTPATPDLLLQPQVLRVRRIKTGIIAGCSKERTCNCPPTF